MTRLIYYSIEQLRATYVAQLPTELTDVSTDNSLSPVLAAPTAYIAAFEPDRNVTPFLMLWESDSNSLSFTHDGVGQRAGNEFFEVSAHVCLVSNLGQNLQTGSERLRHYATALYQVIENNRRLGVTNLECEVTSISTGKVLEAFTNESSMRRGAMLDLRIWGHTPP